MKAITLWQPWASLLASGAKIYETRSWATKYRGPIAIHAATKKVDTKSLPGAAVHAMVNAVRPITAKCATTTMYVPFDLLPRGAIVATAELVECWEILRSGPDYTVIEKFDGDANHHFRDITGSELLFGDWTPGRYAWEFANMKMLDTPIPVAGHQGLWNYGGFAHENQ